MYRVSRLSNGLTIATAEMPHMASVSIGLWVAVGGRYEPVESSGIYHFIEHMLFKGTRRRTAREISAAIEGVGGYVNAFTGEESTCFYARAASDRLGDMLDVLADMFLESRFAPADIEKERDVIKEEIAMYLDQPHQHVQELLNETLWPGHPLGRPLTGTAQTIDSFTRSSLLQCIRNNYNSATTLLTAAGPVRHDALVKAARGFARKVPAGKRLSFLPVDALQAKPRIRLHTKNIAQMQIAIGIRVCSRHDERRYALRVLNTVLGDNMSSRLFQVLREDHGLAYSVHSSVNYLDDTGLLTISAGLDTEKFSKAMNLLMRETGRFAKEVPGAKELRQARDYLIGQLDLTLENTENQMMWLGEHLLGYGKVIAPAEIKRHVSQVTGAQVRQVARDFLRPQNTSVAIVSPLKRTRGLTRLLWL